MHQCKVHYSGRVQGVGFRYTTQQVAKNFQVDGYVLNLSDGRVRVLASGDQDELRSFFAAVAEQLETYIVDSEFCWSQIAANERPATGFTIRRSTYEIDHS